jgi:oligoendopeptidase F
MAMFDINANVGKINKSFTFDESVDIVRSAFDSIDPRFSTYLEKYIGNGQIDVFPRIHKKSGAYCWKRTNLPTFVLLNHVSDFRGIRIFAHEMGHAIHGEFSRAQSTLYEACTISTAEVASKFFENVVFDSIFEKLSPEDQVIALHDNIIGSINSVFGQIALFNFEIELHETLRAIGFVSKEKMSELMVKHRMLYLGDAVKLNPEDGFLWVSLSHIRQYFYVYTYAYGELISSAMYAQYNKDKSFVTKLEKFLSAGGSDTPENIFKSIGVDTEKDEFWTAGLKAIDNQLDRLEKLVSTNEK